MNTVEKYKIGTTTLILTPEKIFVKTNMQSFIVADSNGNSTVKLHRLRRAAKNNRLKSLNDIVGYLKNTKGVEIAYLKPVSFDWYKEYLEC